MAGKGGIRNTSWKAGQNPTRKKGAKSQATKVKERLGLTGWERLCDYILNDGADKYVEEMQKLKGKDFHIAYNALTEFVKPKLSRQEMNVKGNIHIADKEVVFE